MTRPHRSTPGPRERGDADGGSAGGSLRAGGNPAAGESPPAGRGPTTGVPGAVRAMLALAAPLIARSRREETLGDLAEEFVEAIQPRYGHVLGTVWLLAHLCRSAVGSRRRALAGAARGHAGSSQEAGQRGRLRALANLARDARFALRQARTDRLTTAVVVATLGVGIAVPTVAFSILNGVLLRPLPLTDADRIVGFGLRRGVPGLQSVAYPDIEDLRDRSRSFSELAVWNPARLLLHEDGTNPEYRRAVQVSPSYFAVMDIRAAAGRPLLPSDAEPGAEPVAVLSHAAWLELYGADPDVIGTVRTFGASTYRIVGVGPPSFRDPVQEILFRSWEPALAWLSLRPFDRSPGTRNDLSVWAVGRLASESSIESAQAELDRLMADLERQHPDTNAERRYGVAELREILVVDVRGALVLLLAAATLVLILACANVAGLLLARGATRSAELAVRVALGASRGRIAAQLLIEAALLAVGSGLVGLWAGATAARAVARLASAWIPRQEAIHLDPAVLGFAVTVAGASVLLFGVLPALHLSRSSAERVGRSRDPAAGVGRVRALLVVVQVALAFTLLSASGLLLRSSQRLAAVDIGVEMGGVLTARLDLPSARYPDAEAVAAAGARIVEASATVPGVTAAALTSTVPLHGRADSTRVTVAGADEATRAAAPMTPVRSVTPAYFDVVGMRTIAGRSFNESDRHGAPAVGIVNESLGRTLVADGDPLGTVVTVRGEERRIVGIVADARLMGPDRAPPPALYTPYLQERVGFMIRVPTLVVLTDGVREIEPVLRSRLATVDPDLPINDVQPLTAFLDRRLATPRQRTALASLLAIVANGLAAVGVAGVVAGAVSRRRHEFGVRKALGATGASLLRLVLGRTLMLVGTGIAIGVGGSLLGTRVLARFLFEVRPADPWVLAATTVGMLALASLAALRPAYRASRLPPAEVLRTD